MRKLVVSTFISLDGVVQAPGGPQEDTSGGFPYGGWMVPYADEIIGGHVRNLMAAPFELLLGRRTYDIFAGHWPHIPADSPTRHLADRLNGATKHVATHRPEALPWRGSQALRGDLVDAVRALQRQDGPDLLTFGSSDMVRQLLAAGAVDDLWLLVYPVMFGRGRRMFGDDAQPSAFRLAHAGSTSGGVLLTRYLREGQPPRTGSFDTVA